MRVLARLTGGRPMDRVAYCFDDVVSGQSIYLFEDRLGRFWMATHRWSWFRVRPEYGPEIWRDDDIARRHL